MASYEDELGDMLLWVQREGVKAVLVEGPRGSGKSTLCSRILEKTDMVFYKTWGVNQRTERAALQAAGLDLPQGAYFALDFLSQVETTHPVLVDRSILSSLVYQVDMWGHNTELHQYYVDLMRRCPAVLLYLDVSAEEALSRRVSRGGKDEQRVDLMKPMDAWSLVTKDINDYDAGLDTFIQAGLAEETLFQLGTTTVYVYKPKDDSNANEDT